MLGGSRANLAPPQEPRQLLTAMLIAVANSPSGQCFTRLLFHTGLIEIGPVDALPKQEELSCVKLLTAWTVVATQDRDDSRLNRGLNGLVNLSFHGGVDGRLTLRAFCMNDSLQCSNIAGQFFRSNRNVLSRWPAAPCDESNVVRH